MIPDLKKARQYVLERLARELRKEFSYHSIAHTRDDVLPNTERLADLEGISDPEDRLILRTAALYHDIGFVETHLDHEEASMRIAAKTLPQFGYSQAQIECIQQLIRATKIPQKARHPLAILLADADLDVLGREDYFSRNLDLYHELQALGKTYTLEEWHREQLRFIKTHTYLSRAAQITRLPGKLRNIKKLETMIGLPEAVQQEGVLSSSRATGK